MNLQAFILICSYIFITYQECNATLMQFATEYSLGRQDQLNRTFIKISERVSTLNNVSYQKQSSSYKIYNIKPHYFYIDSKQKAYIDNNTNLIAVVGGVLNIQFEFEWTKSTGIGGSGVAKSLSDSLGFVKEVLLNTSYAFEQLYDYQNVTFFTHKTNISRIDPATINKNDLQILQQMFNEIEGGKSVKDQIKEELDKVYSYYLNLSLYEQKRIIDKFFQYKWKGPSGSINIQYEIQMTGINLQRQGITAIYMEKIVNDSDWKCEHDVPSLHWNPKVYGSQQFMTFDLFKNTIRYAIQKNAIDTELNRKNWESRFFQYFAGDLYEVIPKLTQLYYATQPVLGNCKASTQNLKIIKGNHDSLNVTLQYKCQLGIGRQKIAGFTLDLGLQVEGVPHHNKLQFIVKAFNYSANYESNQKFKIVNTQLANHMIMHSLNRLKQQRVFGSDWPIYPKDYPHLVVEEDHLVIYDSTHVDPYPEAILQAK